MEMIRCEAKHLEAVATFYDKVTDYLSKNINYPKWMPGRYPGRESAREAIARGEQYACLDGETVLGVFVLNNDPQGAYEKGDWSKELAHGEYMVIHALATDPERYGSGVAKAMVNFCMEMAKAFGYPAIRLDVVPGNEPAERLYTGLGFAFAGEKDLDRGYEHIPTFRLFEYNF